MCTLTYIPNATGFLITSNRDEKENRGLHTKPPESYRHHGTGIMYSKDEAGGTWLAAADNGFVLCLLNGAFHKHLPQPPYRRSRGLVLLDFYKFNDVAVFSSLYDFSGIEPFTLVIIQKAQQTMVSELRWDGQELHKRIKNASSAHIWSSVTLYDESVIAERATWFSNWRDMNPDPGIHEILFFHHFGGKGDRENDLVMNRGNGLRTVSISCVKNCADELIMHHEDVLRDMLYVQNMRVQQTG